MSTNTGGSAFPQNTQIVAPAGQVLHTGFMGGMTLRDYFAAKAMQAIVSHEPTFAKEFVEMAARDAYAYADAMMKARGNT